MAPTGLRRLPYSHYNVTLEHCNVENDGRVVSRVFGKLDKSPLSRFPILPSLRLLLVKLLQDGYGCRRRVLETLHHTTPLAFVSTSVHGSREQQVRPQSPLACFVPLCVVTPALHSFYCPKLENSARFCIDAMTSWNEYVGRWT